MIVRLAGKKCTVIRELGDKPLNAGFAGKESLLLYRVKQELNRQGFDFIKKRMQKDGHMVDEFQQYLRERKAVQPPHKMPRRQLAIYNNYYAIQDAGEAFEVEGRFEFRVENLAEK